MSGWIAHGACCRPMPTASRRHSRTSTLHTDAPDMPLPLLLALLLSFPIPACADLTVTDDTGRAVQLPAPARRIVAVAPHAAELLHAAGAGAALVGVVQYADFPPAVRALPSVGSYTGFDLEALLALKPDLVIGWDSGNPPAQLARIEALGIPVFRTEARVADDIATDIEKLGELAGTAAVATQA
ncbi:MAG: hypothetical protein EKK65_07755, partial [Lysobacterales bacterium]